MTNQPEVFHRRRRGRRPGDDRTAVYPGQHGHTGYQQPYDWRYTTQQQQHAQRQHAYRQQPYDPTAALLRSVRAAACEPTAASEQAFARRRPHRRRAGDRRRIGGHRRRRGLMAKPDPVAGGTQITAAPACPRRACPPDPSNRSPPRWCRAW